MSADPIILLLDFKQAVIMQAIITVSLVSVLVSQTPLAASTTFLVAMLVV